MEGTSLKKRAAKKNERLRTIRIFVVCIILAGLLVGFYFYLSHKMERTAGEEVTVSQTQRVLARNLEINYPPSPREVIKYYSEITQCFYNEEHSQEELEELAMRIQRLYADELSANQTKEEYLDSLKSEIAAMKKNKQVISSYSPSASTDVEYYTQDGSEWAKIYCLYNIRKETSILTTNEVFLLQKDEDGHWKIYGWKLAEE